MKRLCVYCGSSPGKTAIYIDAAHALANELLARGIGLVYGGASVGLMGEIANTMLKGGGEVIGVIPQALADKELAHPNLTQLDIVDSMHERKARMADLSDGFIALPGGLGTLEELFEILTWAQLGLHQKPCGLLNFNHYYDHLVTFLEHGVDQEFIKAIHRDMLIVETVPCVLLEKMTKYHPPVVGKWLSRAQI